jgi:NTP pyrophosphatase (non-canonical NTP hydrolase)
MDIKRIEELLQAFADERDWNQFHSPKNLSMALSAEVGELLEHFQWVSEEDSFQLSEKKLTEVGEELADILLYLIRLSDQLNIDLEDAAMKKIAVNHQKYPADQVRGSSLKYTEYN